MRWERAQVKATGKRGRSSARATVTLELNDGTEVDLGRNAIALQGEARAQAVEQLMALKAQLDAHLTDLRQAEAED